MGRMRPTSLALLTLTVALCAVSGTSSALAGTAATSNDAALAKRIVLRAADFPSGWQGQLDTQQDSGCFKGPLQEAGSTAAAQSQRLDDGTGRLEVSGLAIAYPSPALARKAFAVAGGVGPVACYRTSLGKTLAAAGYTMKSFSGSTLKVDKLGDRIGARRLAVVIKTKTATGTIWFDLTFVQRGRFLLGTTVIDEVGKPDLGLEHAAIAKSVARVPR